MKTVRISVFKEQCLSLLDKLGPDGLVVTRHGKPVARVLPFEADSSRLIGCLQGKLKIKGDILATEARWDAES